ncbi:hypothetical protein [Pelosinus propionicus]|uniref:hypothetical protein n=1 Tax=Pelosinus propionicus TaxID=380084 RepID=UPI001113ED55|nr:hypothetical protein [Pelosinus propionicus]
MQAYHLPDISLTGLLDERIAQDTIQEYYRSTIGHDDYYSLPAVYQCIQETTWCKHKKERICNWLRLIAQTDSFAESSVCFLQGSYLNDEARTWGQGSKRDAC